MEIGFREILFSDAAIGDLLINDAMTCGPVMGRTTLL